MMINSDFEFQIKMVIIGDSGVGKTNFIFQFTEGRFSQLHVTTVGFDYKAKIIKLPTSKKKVKLQIWDTAGQERYMALNKSIFQKVQGIIIMYDLTNRSSFENLTRWFTLVSQNVSNLPRILVANKLDLAEDNRIVSEDEGYKLAKEYHMPFFEGSGRSGENVDKIFAHLAEMVYTSLINEQEFIRSINSTKQLEAAIEKEKRGCCK